jgi:hypothetical protein
LPSDYQAKRRVAQGDDQNSGHQSRCDWGSHRSNHDAPGPLIADIRKVIPQVPSGELSEATRRPIEIPIPDDALARCLPESYRNRVTGGH